MRFSSRAFYDDSIRPAALFVVVSKCTWLNKLWIRQRRKGTLRGSVNQVLLRLPSPCWLCRHSAKCGKRAPRDPVTPTPLHVPCITFYNSPSPTHKPLYDPKGKLFTVNRPLRFTPSGNPHVSQKWCVLDSTNSLFTSQSTFPQQH